MNKKELPVSKTLKNEKEDKKDPIDETNDESFPASDPPSWTLGVKASDKPIKKR